MTEKVDIYSEEYRWQVMADVRAVGWGDEEPRERLEQTITNSERFQRKNSNREARYDALRDMTATQLGVMALKYVYRASDEQAAEIMGISPEKFSIHAILLSNDERLPRFYKPTISPEVLDASLYRLLESPHTLEAGSVFEWVSLVAQIPAARQAFRSVSMKQKGVVLSFAADIDQESFIEPQYRYHGDSSQRIVYAYNVFDQVRERVRSPLERYYGLETEERSKGIFWVRMEALRRLQLEPDYDYWTSKVDPIGVEISEKILAGTTPDQLSHGYGISRKMVFQRFASTVDAIDRQRRGYVQNAHHDMELHQADAQLITSTDGGELLFNTPSENRFILVARVLGMPVRDIVQISLLTITQVEVRIRNSTGYVRRHIMRPDEAPDYQITSTTALERLRMRLSEIPVDEVIRVLPLMGARHKEIIIAALQLPPGADYTAIPTLAALSPDSSRKPIRNAGNEFFALVKR